MMNPMEQMPELDNKIQTQNPLSSSVKLPNSAISGTQYPESFGQLEAEYIQAYIDYKNDPNPTTTTKLLKAVKPVMDIGVNTYAGKNQNPMIRSKARQIIIESFDSYDPEKASMKSHLMAQLRGLQRYNAKQQQILSVPEQVALDQQHLVEAENELKDILGRDPSDAELSDHTGLSLKRIQYVRGYRQGVAESQITSIRPGEEGAGGFDPGVMRSEFAAELEFLYYDLSPTDQLILEYYFGMNGAPRLSVSEIAQRLNMTPGAVSQRTSKIQEKLYELQQMELF